MEVQLAVKGTKSAGARTPPHRNGGGGGEAKNVPNYLRPSTGSCHHVCKYGGTHAFEEKEAPKAQPKPRKQPPPAPDNPKRSLIRVRLVPRKLFGDFGRAQKADNGDRARKQSDGVEWKDIVAYHAAPAHGSSATAPPDGKIVAAGDARKKDAAKGKTKAKIGEGEAGHVQVQRPPQKNTKHADVERVKPPKGKKKPAALVVDLDREMVHGYQILSPSLLQTRADLLRDLEREMVQEATHVEQGRAAFSLDDQDEYAAAVAAESSRPIPAHRRVKSMSVSMSSRSVRFPFARQASKNASSSAAFKLRSKSSKAPAAAPPEEEKPARGRGIQLRLRSLRRRGVGGGFVVPAVALRHQKTLEKKRSQRLYNSEIEETATKLAKSRKSRVKALVGAFESVISKIAK